MSSDQIASRVQAADFNEYVERKKQKGEKPMDRKEWEAKNQGKGESKKEPEKEDSELVKGLKDWQKQDKDRSKKEEAKGKRKEDKDTEKLKKDLEQYQKDHPEGSVKHKEARDAFAHAALTVRVACRFAHSR